MNRLPLFLFDVDELSGLLHEFLSVASELIPLLDGPFVTLHLIRVKRFKNQIFTLHHVLFTYLLVDGVVDDDDDAAATLLSLGVLELETVASSEH